MVAAAAVAAVLVAGVVALVATSSSGAPSVPASSVEAQIVAQTGLAPAQVHCPGRLPAEVGASIVCTASSDGGRSQPLRTTVTSVAGEQVTFDITTE